MFEAASFPGYSRESLFDLLVFCYFSAEELLKARHQLEQGAPYVEVVALLIEQAQNEFRRRDCCLTIPGGHVLAHPPDRAPGDLSYISFHVDEIARAAFPPPPDAADVNPAGALTLWGQHTPPASGKNTRQRPAAAKPPSSLGRMSFDPACFGRQKDQEGWVAKARGEDLGLGYSVHPLANSKGWWIDLIHGRSGRPVASITLNTTHVDHKLIQEWLIACLPIVDWKQAYQTVLRLQPEQKGMRKWQVLSQRLRVIWSEQQQAVRQLALMNEIEMG